MSFSAQINSVANNPVGTYRLSNLDFQQLGRDLATGNLAGAQSDFAILQQAFGQPVGASASASSSSPMARAFQQLSSDLNSGNLSGAQKDYLNIQQDLQNLFSLHLHHNRTHAPSPWVGQQAPAPEATAIPQASAAGVQASYATLAQQLQYALGKEDSTPGGAVTNPVSFLA